MTANGNRGFLINELSFYQASPALTPSPGNLILTTSTLEVDAVWLIHHIIQQTLNSTVSDSRKVILVSLLQDRAFHERQLRKFGVDLKNARYSSKLRIVDGFSSLDLNQDLRAPSSVLNQLVEQIRAEESSPIVLIDNLDFLLTAASATAADLLSFVTDLQLLRASILLFCKADIPLIRNDQMNSPMPIVNEQTQLLTQLVHRAVLTVSLRSLETGRADDITGVLKVSNGGKPLNYGKSNLSPSLVDKVLEKEYLYFLTSDTSIRLFYR